MFLYLTVILLSMAAMVLINQFVFMPSFIYMPLWLNILGVVVTTLALIAIDGGLAAVSHSFQKKYNPFSKYFTVTQKGKRRLERTGIKRYKDYLPDLGMLVKFPKRTIVEPDNKDYIYLYLLETCSGELGHIAGAFAGFILALIPWGLFTGAAPFAFVLCFGVPLGFVNFVLSLLPVLALRYNRYKLSIVYKRLIQLEERTKMQSESGGAEKLAG